MKLLVYILNIFNRYSISIYNLGLFNTIKIVLLRILPSKNISKITSKKFGTIYWRSYSDYGVISHFFTPQLGFDTNGDFPKIIVDIGANIGIETIRFNKLFPNSKFISVEPEMSNFTLLEKNLTDYKNAKSINKAIWNKKTILSIKNHSQKNSQTFFVEEKRESDQVEIESLSVKDLMNIFQISIIDILKIDIEGAESIIFDETCDEWVSSVKVIIVECPDNDTPFTTMKIFNAFDRKKIKFNTYINGENLIFIRENCDWTPKKITYY